jgi:hypothetical protein
MSAFKVPAACAFATIVCAMGCQGHRSNEPMTADFQRDLSLASSVRSPHTGTVSAIELNSNGAPSGNSAGIRLGVPTLRRAPSPATSKVVAAVPIAPLPTTDAAASVAVATPQVASGIAEAANASAAAEPQIFISPAASGPSAGDADYGRGDSGRGDSGRHGGGVGGVIGAIIRGTSAGVDNCEPTGSRRGARDHGGIAGTILGGDHGIIGTDTRGGGTRGGMGIGGATAARPRY